MATAGSAIASTAFPVVNGSNSSINRHKQSSLEGTEWKDVGEEVANEVERI